MSPVESVQSVLRNYAVFTGRASRSEYWWFILAYVVGALILSFTASLAAAQSQSLGMLLWLLYIVFLLALILPSLAVLVRRLHDVGKSGWWYWISFIPLLGTIWLLVLLVQDSDGDNEYGTATVSL